MQPRQFGDSLKPDNAERAKTLKQKNTMNTQKTPQQQNALDPSILMEAIGSAFRPSAQPKSQSLSIFEAQVIDRLMHRKYIPFDIARNMVNEFAGLCKWGHSFGNSADMIAGQIYDRARNGIDDIDF